MSSITLSDGEGRDGGGRRRAISCAMASQQTVERISSPLFPQLQYPSTQSPSSVLSMALSSSLGLCRCEIRPTLLLSELQEGRVMMFCSFWHCILSSSMNIILKAKKRRTRSVLSVRLSRDSRPTAIE